MECLVCPHPGRNLPMDWEMVLLSRGTRESQHLSSAKLMFHLVSWLYQLWLTVNTNFCLKNKDQGIKNDPLLGDGFTHWVPGAHYKAYINEYGYQEEVSCHRLSLHVELTSLIAQPM
jgi:hypothetical protein